MMTKSNTSTNTHEYYITSTKKETRMSKKKYRFTAQIGDQKVSYRNESLEQIRGLRDYLIREMHDHTIISPIQHEDDEGSWMDIEGTTEHGQKGGNKNVC